MTALAKPSPQATVLSLAQLLEQQPPSAPPCLVEPGLLPPQGILFVGGEPKVGKSLLVANLALALASGSDRTGFSIPAARRVLICHWNCSRNEQLYPHLHSFVFTLRTDRGLTVSSAMSYSRMSTQRSVMVSRACFSQSPESGRYCATLKASGRNSRNWRHSDLCGCRRATVTLCGSCLQESFLGRFAC